MNEEDDWWWGWSGLAGGIWATVVCLVVVLGSVVNLAVLIHWFTSRPSQESPSAALPFVDLLMCMIAAPLRYAVHVPSKKVIAEKRDFHPVLSYLTEIQQNDTTIVSDLESEYILENENVSLYVRETDIESNYTLKEEVIQPIENASDAIHAMVVFICLASLHVVVIVALHRLALLLRCSPNVNLPLRIAPPLLVLLTAFATAGIIIGSLHASGQFTSKLPLLGMVDNLSASSPPPTVVVGFLSYVAGLCAIAVFCYGAIITALVYQGRDRSVSSVQSRQELQPSSCSGVSSLSPPHPEEEAAVQAYNGHGKAIRACMTVVSVLVTLAVCWAIPVSLTLYALLTEAHITPALPYSDVLVLLSGLIHPFVYGEGWMAVAACFGGMGHAVTSVAYKIGLTRKTRTRVRPAEVEMRTRPRRERQHHNVRICCPCRTTRIHDTHLFSEVATFVNSFPLRNPLSRNEPEYL